MSAAKPPGRRALDVLAAAVSFALVDTRQRRDRTQSLSERAKLAAEIATYEKALEAYTAEAYPAAVGA